MKVLNLKSVMTVVMLVSTISFSGVIMADEQMTLPVISKPSSLLEEGTQRELSAGQIAELLPWAKDSKMFLSDLLENIQGLPMTEKVERLVEGIKTAVGESAPKNSELFMRYSLNRALVLNGVLEKETNAEEVGSIDARLRVLVASVKIAIKYYDNDLEMMTKKTKAPYIAYGIEYFDFLNELNKSIFDASAQYAIQRTALEWLQWDLYRDLNNTGYAPQISKIFYALKGLPTKKLSDSQSIAYIRQMKSLAKQLNISSVEVELRNQREANDKIRAEQEASRLKGEMNKKMQLKIGDKVYYSPANYKLEKDALARIAAIQPSGQYTIKYDDGTIFSNLNREELVVEKSCGVRFCSGDIVMVPERNFMKVIILGTKTDGNYLIKILEGEFAGAAGAGWTEENVAATIGCSTENICVGTKMINTKYSSSVTIIGLQIDNKYIIKFTSGQYKDQISKDWQLDQLVPDLK